MYLRAGWTWAAVIGLALFVACDRTASHLAGPGSSRPTAALAVTTVAVATVMLTPATASIGVGGTQQFVVTLRDSTGNVLTGRTITWMCSNFAVAVAVLDASGKTTRLMRGGGVGTPTHPPTSDGKRRPATPTAETQPP